MNRWLLAGIPMVVLSLSTCAATQFNSVAQPSFTPVQPTLFAVAGSLSNAWADFDKDGDLDFSVSIKGGEIRLYRNDRGLFTSIGSAMGLPLSGDEIRGLSWGDYDLDGDPDLLAGSNVAPTRSRSYVFRNDITGFVEVAADIGLTVPGQASRQSNWIDYDGDGDLDLYAADRSGLNWLYRNNNSNFERLPFGSAPIDPRRSVGACWFDIDRDGDLDLFLANQNGDSDALWRNDGNRFVDIGSDLGMDQTQRLLADGGVGCAVGDYDNDGDFDLYVTTYGNNLLYRNEGDGSFTEVAEQLGVSEPIKAVAAAWGDYDNDGDLDLMSVGYTSGEGGSIPQSRLYVNDGGAFTNVISSDHELNVGDHGVEWIDYDNDGDLDLSLTDGYGPVGGHPLLRNNLPASARARSLAVLVLDAQGRFAYPGAELRVYRADGNLLASRLVGTGGGYNTQSATPVYVALPDQTPVTLELTFMSPNGPVIEKLSEIVPVGQTIEFRRGSDSIDFLASGIKRTLPVKSPVRYTLGKEITWLTLIPPRSNWLPQSNPKK